MLSRALVGIVCGFSLLTPVAILMLCNLDPGQSLVVIAIFGVSLIVVMVWRQMHLDAVLLGLSAYLAVIVSLVANQQHN